MSENLAEHYALPTPQEKVEDEITEQRSIVVTALLQSGGLLMPHLYKRPAIHWKTPPRFDLRESEHEEEESQPLRKNRDAPVVEGHHQGQAQEEGTLEVTYQTGPDLSGPASGAGEARGGKGYSR